MHTPKETIALLFLHFVARYQPLRDARFATLGGTGIEAKVWHEQGIPSEHGWLIEINRMLRRGLIKNHRYQNHNRLGTFMHILRGHTPEAARIDGFHFDLCGTMRTEVQQDLTQILPAILESGGRCLAITVAEQRRNLILEQWSGIMAQARRTFGHHAGEWYQKIKAQQQQIPRPPSVVPFFKTGDPAKAAKRELGLLFEVAQKVGQFQHTVDSVERYVYVSRLRGRPFKMRTFFLHFEADQRVDAPTRTIERWVSSPLYFFKDETFVNIKLQKDAVKPLKGLPMSKLAEIARVLGGDELAEYEKLVEDSAALQAIKGFIASETHAPDEKGPKTQVVEETQKRKSRAKGRQWHDFTEVEKINWLLITLELVGYSKGSRSGENWEQMLKDNFGRYTPELNNSIRAALARTNGRYREGFIARIKKAFDEEAQPYLDRLLQIPVNIIHPRVAP